MIQIFVKSINRIIFLDENSEESFKDAVAAIGCSMQELKDAVENIMINATALLESEMERLESEISYGVAIRAEGISQYTYYENQKKRVYFIYRSKLHPPEKHRLPLPTKYTIRIRNNI